MGAFVPLFRWLSAPLVAMVLVVLGGCSRAPDPADDGQIRVLVSIAPLEGLARSLAPEGARVESLIPPGESVHTYQLRPEDRARVARADLVVMVGLGLEGGATGLLTSAGPRLVRFDRVVGIEDDHAGHDHSHAGHDHDHTIDPHLWLDADLVTLLVGALESRLGALSGADPVEVGARAEALRTRVQEMDRAYREALAPVRGRAIVTHHDAWSRLADRYGLRVAAVLRPVATGEPTPRELGAAREAIEREGVGMIFIEPQFDATLARRLGEAAGVRVGVLDPIGTGDWFAMMRANLEVLVDGLSAGGAEGGGEGP